MTEIAARRRRGVYDRHVDRRDAVLAAAWRLAREGRFAAVTVREIAARAEVSVGTVYKHFSSKEQLLCAVVARRLPVYFAQLDSVSAFDGDPVASTGRLVDRLGATACANVGLSESVLRACLVLDLDGAAEVATIRPHLARAFARSTHGDVADRRALAVGGLLADVWTVEVPGLISGRVPYAGYRRRMMRSAQVFLEPGQRDRAREQ